MNQEYRSLTRERFDELMQYNPDTGEFTWRVGRRGTAKAGSLAGSDSRNGYWFIHIDGRRYSAHRLAWWYMTGSLPEAEIDHANGDGHDNRFENIRACCRSENVSNRTIMPFNSSGLKGVTKNRDWWTATIWKNKTRKYLGSFKTKEAAHAAYISASKELHGEFARSD